MMKTKFQTNWSISDPIYSNRMGFDIGLMKVTVLFPCYTDKKRYSHVPTWRGQSSKSSCSDTHSKRLPRGYAFMCSLSLLSFTNERAATAVMLPPQEMLALLLLCMLFFMRLNTHVRTYVNVRCVYTRPMCAIKRPGPMLSEWHERKCKAETNELNFVL